MDRGVVTCAAGLAIEPKRRGKSFTAKDDLLDKPVNMSFGRTVYFISRTGARG
jgi:hypothetical protein